MCVFLLLTPILYRAVLRAAIIREGKNNIIVSACTHPYVVPCTEKSRQQNNDTSMESIRKNKKKNKIKTKKKKRRKKRRKNEKWIPLPVPTRAKILVFFFFVNSSFSVKLRFEFDECIVLCGYLRWCVVYVVFGISACALVVVCFMLVMCKLLVSRWSVILFEWRVKC